MAFTSDKELKQLYSRVDDAIRLSELRHKPCFLGFLNEHESFLVRNYISGFGKDFELFGGYEGAERLMLCVSEFPADKDDYPIREIYYKFRKGYKLSHRDFLGALMNLGIERDCIGDILVEDGQALVFAREEIADYITSGISKIGRVGVENCDGSDMSFSYQKNLKELKLIISSMRLDVVVAALTGLSRGKTAQLILSGKVFLNYSEASNSSCTIKENDILTIRGNGKYIIKGQNGVTKKGRLMLNVEHYK